MPLSFSAGSASTPQALSGCRLSIATKTLTSEGVYLTLLRFQARYPDDFQGYFMPKNAPKAFETTPAVLCALLLGRIQVGISRAGDGTLQILAARLIRESLMAALRQEGHEFTDERFFTWYAGLETLSDGSRPSLRPPKALCQAILTEFRHSPWQELADASESLLKAFLAPTDFLRGGEHEDTHSVISEARSLIGGLDAADDALPFDPVRMLFAAAARTARFARQERTLDLIGGIAVEREDLANSRWALDILAGGYLAPRHGLPVAMPIPGLVVLPLALPDPDMPGAANADEAAISALHDALFRLDRWLGDAERDAALLRARLQDRRSSGRALQLARKLSGFGALRGRQIEELLGASRPGVGVIVNSLEAAGLIATHASRNAARLHSYAPGDRVSDPAEVSGLDSSSPDIEEYEASMRRIDELLSRSSFGE
ncbi:MarR family transcriptional regulator [Novosphingobium aerophilum]